MSIIVVQHTSTTTFHSVTQSATLSGVTAGNAIIAVSGHVDSAGTGPTFVISDGQGTYTNDAYVNLAGFIQAVIGSLFNANAGSHTVSCVAQSGAAGNSTGEIALLEVSGIGVLDEKNTATSTNTTPSIALTGNIATVNELIVCITNANTTLAGATAPPTASGTSQSWVSLFSQLTGASSVFADLDYLINTSGTGTVGAAWGTLSSSADCSMAIAAYKPSGNKLLLLS
jgi:hypothetical protein